MSLSTNCDFNFSGDKSNRFIPFIIGFLMYSATIAVMSGFFTQKLTSEWNDSLNGHMTIEFQSNIAGATETLTENQKEEIIKIVKSTSEIKSIKLLSESEILKILEPWLSGTSIPDDFPLPTIFDVESKNGAKIDLLLLTEKLSKVSSGVKIYDHANWYTPILQISNALFFFAILLSIWIFVTVSSTVIFITKQTLNAHENIVKILQLIGATNTYIASQFKKYYFSVCCQSSFLSIFLGALTLIAVIFVFGGKLDLTTIKYAVILFVMPIITTMIVMITSKKSVIFFLKNDKWIN